jgi:hypothetical protein
MCPGPLFLAAGALRLQIDYIHESARCCNIENAVRMLPYDSYKIESTERVPALVARLQSRTAAPRFAGRANFGGDFTGTVWNDGFHIKPAYGRQVSFVPELYGRFIETASGTSVVVEMLPGIAILAIVAILGGCAGLLIFSSGWRVFLAIGGGVFLLWLMCIAGFWLDRGESRRRLTTVLCEPARPKPVDVER